MDYCDIKNALCKKGYTLTRVARELGLAGPQAVQQVCRGRHRSARTEKFISDLTGIPLHKLFPKHYTGQDRFHPGTKGGRRFKRLPPTE